MAKDSEVLVLNDYGGGTFERRVRTSKTGKGKARYTVTIKSEPLLVQTSPRALGAGPAQAIAEHLKQRVADIKDTVSPATMKARLTAQKAVVDGKPWAAKRYSGGRIGTRAPARSDRLFNDSGRLVESIAVGAKGDGYVVNVAGNRFDPTTLNGGEAALLRIMERLRELVPEWGDAKALMDVLSVRRAIKAGLADALEKANERTVELKKQLMNDAVGRVVNLFRLVA